MNSPKGMHKLPIMAGGSLASGAAPPSPLAIPAASARSTQITKLALLMQGRRWSCKTGLGSRKAFLLP